jgi:hypothetical protein
MQIWPLDPDEMSLKASSDKRQTDALPGPLCAEMGRRLLLAELTFADWVLRRVETIQFERQRSVSRKISVQFIVPADAPVFRRSNGQKVYLVPLSIMRRRTLVSFEMEDESGARLPMLGIRVAQQLDASIMLAAAASTSTAWAADARVHEFIKDVVVGTVDKVERRVKQVEAKKLVEPLDELVERPLFRAVFERLRRNFSLYVLLDVAKGRHRTLHLSFDEPTDWKLQQSTLDRTSGGRWLYHPGGRVPVVKHIVVYMLEKLGITATRVRFQIPAAENAASYHFEATAPPGVRIVSAALLAGRPHDTSRRVSRDRVVGHSPTVGLHAVEIPNNSLCRVQLGLRVPAAGWLTQLVMSCAVIMTVLGSIYVHWTTTPTAWNQDQITNVVVILITASAATATLIAQRDFHGLAASMVTHLRAIGALSLLLPIFAAGILVYEGSPPWSAESDRRLQLAILGLFVASIALFVASGLALLLSWRAEQRWVEQSSPWDMAASDGQRKRAASRRNQLPDNFHQAVSRLGFDQPAVGIQSAEGWHEVYGWSDQHQGDAVESLMLLGDQLSGSSSAAGCASLGNACALAATCPRARRGQSLSGAR